MECHPGTVIAVRVVERVSEEKMKTMAALLRDPNPIHFDPNASAALGLGARVVNQGPINVGYVMNMLIAWAGDPAAVRRVKVRFQGMVFGGDRLEAGGKVTSVREGPDETIAICDVWLRRTGPGEPLPGTTVLQGTAEVRVG